MVNVKQNIRLAVTGVNGFIGSNLTCWISDHFKPTNLHRISRQTTKEALIEIIQNVNFCLCLHFNLVKVKVSRQRRG